jgi:hypothetical protein
MPLATQFSMRVQIPPSRCRSDSISPRPAPGAQRSEAGINGGAWQPQAGDPVSQASMGSTREGVVEPSSLLPRGRGSGAGANTAQEKAPAAVSTDRPARPSNPVESTALRMRARDTGNGVTCHGPLWGGSPPRGGANRMPWESRRLEEAKAQGSAWARLTSGRYAERYRGESEATSHNTGPQGPDGGLAREALGASPTACRPPPKAHVPRHTPWSGQDRTYIPTPANQLLVCPALGRASGDPRKPRETDGGYRWRKIIHRAPTMAACAHASA